jgi:2-oxoglutarate dehydrogenase E2 component (dihydrolipoamide succinyltransferase)
VTDLVDAVPFSRIRKRTAEHMVRSKATSPHALVVVEVDYDNVDAARRPAASEFKALEGTSLTYLPFIAWATADALREFAHVNASVGDDALLLHEDVHLGVAVDLDFEGLIVPVVHRAQYASVRDLAVTIADLAGRARSRKLTGDDVAGGTFTITNLGGYGTVLTVPVINQPQVGILATDGIRDRPVVIHTDDGGREIGIHPVGNIALAWDHRAFDGAYAAAFVDRIRITLETRDWSADL